MLHPECMNVNGLLALTILVLVACLLLGHVFIFTNGQVADVEADRYLKHVITQHLHATDSQKNFLSVKVQADSDSLFHLASVWVT